MKKNTMAKRLHEARVILLIQFVVIALIIVAVTAVYGLQTQQWSTAMHVVLLVLTVLTLFMLMVYSRAKQLITAFNDDFHSVEEVQITDKTRVVPINDAYLYTLFEREDHAEEEDGFHLAQRAV